MVVDSLCDYYGRHCSAYVRACAVLSIQWTFRKETSFLLSGKSNIAKLYSFGQLDGTNLHCVLAALVLANVHEQRTTRRETNSNKR